MKFWGKLGLKYEYRKFPGQNEILGKYRLKKWIWESFGSKWKCDKVYGIECKYEKMMCHKENMRKYGFKCNIENMMAFY